MNFYVAQSYAKAELKELRELCDLLQPHGRAYTIRQGGHDITDQERTRLQARIFELETSLKREDMI